MQTDLKSYAPSLVLLLGLGLFTFGVGACVQQGPKILTAALGLAGLGLDVWAVWSGKL